MTSDKDFYISDELAEERATNKAAEAAHLANLMAGEDDALAVAAHAEEDAELLHEQQQTPYHQSMHYQGKEAYPGQGYHPTSSELESKISWGLVIAFLVFFIMCALVGGGLLSLALLY